MGYWEIRGEIRLFLTNFADSWANVANRPETRAVCRVKQEFRVYATVY
jgi:hypothetical protein